MPSEPINASLDEAIRQGHQGDGVREKIVGILAASMAVAVPMIMFFLWLQYRSMAGDRYGGLAAPTLGAPQSQPQAVLPEPRLIVDSGADLAKFRAQEDEELTNYGWINRRSNVVRLPIERAMELIVQRGLPSGGAVKSEYDLQVERSRLQQEPPIKEAK